MLYSVIAPAPSLSESDYRDAIEAGPPFVEVPGDYASLLKESDWAVLELIDVTAEYAASLRILVKNMAAMADAISAAIGMDEFLEQKQRRETQDAALDRGLLVREIYLTQAG